MTKNDLILGALVEAHSAIPQELTCAMAALIKNHEQTTGKTVVLENTTLEVKVARDRKTDDVTFTLSIVQLPNNVVPLNSVQVNQ